jgi:hypothetical protein
VTISKWCQKYPGCNWATATGPDSHIFVIDIDGNEGRASLAALEMQHGQLTDTLTSSTGRDDGGEHRWFKYPADCEIRNSASRLGNGLDVRGAGGYVIVPPSTHPSGRIYQWANQEHAITDAPRWFLDLVTAAEKKPRIQAAEIGILCKGARNDGLTRFGGAMRRRGASLEELEAALLEANERRCRPPLSTDEVRRIAASVARYEPGGPDPLQQAWATVMKESHTRGFEQFLALCRHLQTARPSLPIALPLERLGGHLGVDWTQVRRWRRRAVNEGKLQPAECYIPHRKAALYSFNETVPLGEDCPTSCTTSGLVGQLKKVPSGTPDKNAETHPSGTPASYSEPKRILPSGTVPDSENSPSENLNQGSVEVWL